MTSIYHIVTIRVNETSWAHVWRLHFRYLGTGYDTWQHEGFLVAEGDEITTCGYRALSSTECQTIMIVVLPVKRCLGSSLDLIVLVWVWFALLVRFVMSPCVLVKVVRQLVGWVPMVLARLWDNHFGWSGFLDPLPSVNELIFELGFRNSHSN
jgi:hypothetical protein